MDCKTNVQPLLGDFKLKYEETEKAFAPLIIIKTSTLVSQPQENQLVQQPQVMQVSMSRIDCDELKLCQSTVADTTKHTKSMEQFGWRKKWRPCLSLSFNSLEIDDEKNNEESPPIDSKFHGLLSDSGLFKMAGYIGAEWNELALMLDVSLSEQERLQFDNPYNTRKQITYIQKSWRDR